MLSKACKYAVRAILYLAIHSNKDKKIGIKRISEELQSPQPFLAKLLQQLSTHNLVSSTKGPGGGFYLSEEDLNIKLWDIIVNIDGTERFDECFLGLALCSDKYPCPVHHLFKPFKNQILNDFKHKTIYQLKEEIETKGTLLSLKLLEK
ncbi:Rrf2 family transcriptional regulator [Wenyingzhuangia sp. 2_MG-2023]|uniref:RrF2 family transcriptional regulator n=1 Tax=Wenyingzhuangia sp. 2_MG-2023 TaxID=3062639 RepID=UPI0026E4721D|nr:Rrf2 family transcriptional regulator [Wenyingzhuangia sp. 2_MG-2023]MDO6737221.1 Rrf2 family transcriptional regulator [Wenyingzhuangia sp. 2_MG-2023]MDO6801701.1 Rrf2 family transcriptional regulator [Wenyingzhuangia sp. 1_MG-2023]